MYAVLLVLSLLPLVFRQVPGQPAFAAMERRVFELVNRQRAQSGLAVLKWNVRVAEEAHRHALNMAGRRFFSHVDPLRGDLTARLRQDKIGWHDCAENIFEEQGYKDPAQRAVGDWMKSPGHRHNILDPKMTETGVGVAIRGDGTYLFSQVFLRP